MMRKVNHDLSDFLTFGSRRCVCDSTEGPTQWVRIQESSQPWHTGNKSQRFFPAAQALQGAR